jgi:hypothetical protein
MAHQRDSRRAPTAHVVVAVAAMSDHASETIGRARVAGDPDLGGGAPRERSTAEMINECFRHQHPEAYGREQVSQVAVPWDLECGRDHMMSSQACSIAEEPMGNPSAVPLDTS